MWKQALFLEYFLTSYKNKLNHFRLIIVGILFIYFFQNLQYQFIIKKSNLWFLCLFVLLQMLMIYLFCLGFQLIWLNMITEGKTKCTWTKEITNLFNFRREECRYSTNFNVLNRILVFFSRYSHIYLVLSGRDKISYALKERKNKQNITFKNTPASVRSLTTEVKVRHLLSGAPIYFRYL